MGKRAHITPIGDEGLYILDTANWRKVRPVMNKDKCTECGICLVFCPVNSVIRDDEKKYHISMNYCKGCGICENECPTKAITMIKEGGDTSE